MVGKLGEDLISAQGIFYAEEKTFDPYSGVTCFQKCYLKTIFLCVIYVCM